MAGVFISYRRDDTAGHAGRLLDALVRRFGEPAVFMDVTDIAPGSDFVETIDRALASCDVLLVLIGRSWLTSADEHGRSRLGNPQDFIRREVATALEKNIPVVPVLVDGARMPTAEQLPPSLEALARHQAIELSDSRWDSDVGRLEQSISGRISATPPAQATRSHASSQKRHLVLGIAIAGVAAAIIIVAFARWASTRSDPSRRVSTSTIPGAPAGSSLAYVIRLPAVARIRVSKQEFQILAVRLEPRDGDSALLSFLVRLTDGSGNGDNFWDDSFRLVLAEGRRTPTSGLNQLVGPFAAGDAEVRFEVPTNVAKTELEISRGTETTRIPVDLGDRMKIPQDGSVDRFGLGRKPLLVNSVARLPVALPGGAEATFEGVTYKVLSIAVDRYRVDTAAMTVSLRCTTDRRSGSVNLWDRNIRLLVDGVPRAPDESVNELVQPGTSKDAAFVFLLEQRPDTLTLTIRQDRTIEIPIDMSRIR